LHQGLHNKWLRRIAHGREAYVIPFDNIVAELVSQLRPAILTSTASAAY
jgi:hypothetical protein